MSMNEGNIVDKVAARLSLDISPALAQLQTLSDETTKALSSAQNAVTTGPKSNGDVYLQSAAGAIMNLRQAIKDLQLQFKEGSLDVEQFYNSLQNLQKTYANALDVKTSTGLINDQALRSAIVNAESQLSKLQDFELQTERDLSVQQAQIQAENTAQYNASVDNQIKQVKLLHDQQVLSAQDAANQLAQIYAENEQRFADNIDKEIALVRQMNSYQAEADKQAMAASALGSASAGSVLAGRSSTSGGLSIGPLNMAGMMAEFAGINMLTQNIMTGIVDIQKQQQGLEQVFSQTANTEQKLNDVTNEFIGIAEKYGQSVGSVLDAAKQWGRQYHDVATAQALVNSSTLLSIVDNIDMTTSAKALEATMNALGMSVTNAAEAQKSSMEIVDQWSNMAHNASVSAQDLAGGVERSAGAARQAGVDLAQLNALVAAGVRNTGESGSTIGTMWKTVFAKISSDTPKIQQAFQTLGISMTDSNGKMKSAYDLIMQISKESGNLDSAQKAAIQTITGGVRQYSRFMQAVSNATTIQNDYNVAMNSSGKANQYAVAQLGTLSTELGRLRDEIQQMAYNASSGGLGTMLSSLTRDITDLIAGLQKMPTWLGYAAAGFTGVILSGKMVSSVITTFLNVSGGVARTLQGAGNAMSAVASTAVRMAGATSALTADLDAKVLATEADIAASEEDAAANAGLTSALAATTVGATEATAAFTALDFASMGIVAGLGILVGGIAYFSTRAGEATQSTKDLTQSIQQETQAVQANNQQFDAQLQTLDQLKSQLESAKAAVDNAKQGTVEYQQAQANLINIEQQLASIVGESAAKQITASNDIKSAINSEMKAQIEAKITELQVDQARIEEQSALTNSVVQETTKRIQAYETEATAAQQAYDRVNNMMISRFGIDTNGGLPNFNVGSDYLSNNQQNIMRLAQERARQMQESISGSASDPFSQEISKLQSLLGVVNSGGSVSTALGGSSSVGGSSGGTPGGGTSSSSSSKSSASSAHSKAMQDYLKNISDLTKSDATGLQPYERNVTNAETSVKNMNTALSAGLTALKNNDTSTKAASDVAKAYSGDVSALHTAISKLGSEDWKLIQEQDNVSKKMKQVNADFKDGKIDAQTHSQAIYQLGQEYDNLTQKLDSNRQAMVQDSQAIKQATQNVTSEITNMLQQAYTDQQANEENALQNTYQPQIDALTAQKDAVDNLIQSLQAQWQAQSNVNTLTDLQNQLSAVEANKSYRVVNADGSVSWTYDQSKAADLQKQIADQQTKMQHDAEIQQLTDQKNALDAQITNLQNTYNEQKKQLDDYWTYKLTQDQLNQDADNLILSNGMSGALTIVQKYATDIIGQYDAIQKAAADAGEAIASANGGASISTSKVSSHGGPKKKTVKAEKGGMVPLNLGVPGQDSVPAILSPGEIVAPSWNDLMSGMKAATSNSPSSMSLHVDKFVFPNVSTANDAQEFMESLVDQVTAALR